MKRLITFIALSGALSLAVTAAPPPPAEALYNDAMAKERAVRTALAPDNPADTVLKAVRTVVQQYELLVRTYPTSGYCDDALWQGGQLSFAAFEKFGDVQDRDAGARLLRSLASQYPASKFARQVAAELAKAGAPGEAKVSAATRPPATASKWTKTIFTTRPRGSSCKAARPRFHTSSDDCGSASVAPRGWST